MFEVKQLRRGVRWRAIVAAVLALGFFAAESVSAQNDDYLFSFAPGSGPSGGSAVVTTQLSIGIGANPSQGFSYGVCHDFTEVQPIATTSAPDLQVLNLGAPPDYNEVNFQTGGISNPGGVTQGMVICFSSCATLPANATTQVLQIEYDLLAPGGTVSTLEYCDKLALSGFPPISMVVVVNGQAVSPATEAGTIQILEANFIRGDSDGNGRLQIGDGVSLLGYLFQGQSEPPCRDSSDCNDDGILDVADAVYFFFFLFGAAPPPPPWPDCGTDPTEDSLDCDDFPSC